MWQGYYVEWTIVVIAVCVLALRALEAAHAGATGSDASGTRSPGCWRRRSPA